MSKRILIIDGHPAAESLSSALAEAYGTAARDAGHEVRTLALADLEFDPILHEGYNRIQDLEPDLLKAQEEVQWAQHMVFAYPIWWGGPPALLKGFFDRVFLPGFAFKYRKDSVFWDRLLTGRSARLLVTMDTPPWYFRWVYRMPGHNQMRRTILEFCGIKPVRTTSFGPVRNAKPERIAGWLATAAALGRKGA